MKLPSASMATAGIVLIVAAPEATSSAAPSGVPSGK